MGEDMLNYQDYLDKVETQAWMEIGRDITINEQNPEDYINKLTNYELVEFFLRVLTEE